MINHLVQPTEEVLKAIVRLEDNSDFTTFMAWLKDECGPVVAAKMKAQKDEVALRWAQGASQVLDDLKEVSANALSWLERMYANKQSKKED